MISHHTVDTGGGVASSVTLKDGSTAQLAGVDASGGVKVHIIANDVGGGGGTSNADNSAYTAGATAGTPLMGAVDDTATTAASENAVAIARITPQRGLHANLRNNAGTEIGTAGAPIRTDPTGSTAQPVTGTFWQATQPVSAASLPLPTGAAQEHTAANSPHSVRLTDGTTFYKGTTPSDTQPISAASLPLPTGAATETTLAAVNTKLATAVTADYDTGGPTQNVQVMGLALPGAGGAVAGGTLTNPVRTDPTGTTTQPVNGTVTANAGSGVFSVSGTVTANAGTGTFAVSVVSGSVGQSGAPWSENITQLAGTAIDVNSGNKSAGTQRVVIATDQPQLTNALKVDGSAVTQPVSGTITANNAIAATGGASKFKDTALNASVVAVKASAGKLCGWYIYNPNSAVAYVQIFDAAAPTLGTTAPDVVLGIPATSAANLMDAGGIDFATQIRVAATTTPTGSTGNASALIASFFYK